MTTSQNSPFDKLSFRQIVLLPKKLEAGHEERRKCSTHAKKNSKSQFDAGFHDFLVTVVVVGVVVVVTVVVGEKKLVQITATSESR